jgi:hypothetical protein
MEIGRPPLKMIIYVLTSLNKLDVNRDPLGTNETFLCHVVKANIHAPIHLNGIKALHDIMN